MKLCSNKNH